jgi:hypothetical protein
MDKFKSQRAQGLVEFALLAPIFFLVLLGVLDLGRAGFFFVVGSGLARDGARFASVYNNGSGLVDAAVTGNLQLEAAAVGIANSSFTMPAGACGTATPPMPPAALSPCQTPPPDNMYIFIENVPGTPHYKKVSTVYAFRPVTPMLSQITGTIYIVATSAMTVEY